MDKNKLKYVLLWMCVILVIASSIFILTRVTEKAKKEKDETEEKEEVKYLNHISYDEIFSIDAPSTYEEVSERNSLNTKGIIELNDEDKASYVLVVATSKVSLNKNYDTFKKESFTQKETFYNTKITNYKEVTIDEHAAEYGEIYYTNQAGINTYIRAYVVETDNYFVQIIMWTTADNEKNVQEEYNKIADSFRERKVVDNQS